MSNTRIPLLKILLFGAATLVVFAIAIIWAASIQRRQTGTVFSHASPPPTEVGREAIGGVFQPPFGVSIAAARAQAARARLEILEWTDDSHRFARIPIRRAMQMLVDRAAASPVESP